VAGSGVDTASSFDRNLDAGGIVDDSVSQDCSFFLKPLVVAGRDVSQAAPASAWQSSLRESYGSHVVGCLVGI